MALTLCRHLTIALNQNGPKIPVVLQNFFAHFSLVWKAVATALDFSHSEDTKLRTKSVKKLHQIIEPNGGYWKL